MSEVIHQLGPGDDFLARLRTAQIGDMVWFDEGNDFRWGQDFSVNRGSLPHDRPFTVRNVFPGDERNGQRLDLVARGYGVIGGAEGDYGNGSIHLYLPPCVATQTPWPDSH